MLLQEHRQFLKLRLLFQISIFFKNVKKLSEFTYIKINKGLLLGNYLLGNFFTNLLITFGHYYYAK